MQKRIPLVYLIIVFCFAIGCSSNTQKGYQLAKKKCTSCHQFVEPKMLDKNTWVNDVLPEMGKRAALGKEERELIEQYFWTEAPDVLPGNDNSKKIVRSNWIFNILRPNKQHLSASTTTMVAYDSSQKLLYTSDAHKRLILRWNNKLEIIDSIKTQYGCSDVYFYDDSIGNRQAVFTIIGTLGPHDAKDGSLLRYDIQSSEPVFKDTLVDELRRPVATAAADLNNDGLTDYITCGFGHEQGALYVSWQQPGNRFVKEEILSVGGVSKVHVEDFNNDGWQDLMVLVGNAEESIRLFTNNKDGSFTMKTLIEFSPVMGSTSMQVVDINNDGLKDIIFTCGDNADLSKILKPYHGLYIYINKGDFKYKQEYFFPINGSIQAIANDFDGDGDLDIATISFFPDFNNNSAEKFLLFEQQAPMQFKIHSPDIDDLGRWICTDIADIDNDGDNDIILGNFSYGFINFPVIKKWWEKRIPFIVLENTSR